MLRPEREDDRFFVGRRLQFEPKSNTEPLPQRKAESSIDTAAERSMHYQLHAAALVEESLDDDSPRRWNRAERTCAL
jgi:hypothetical protein